jgi:glycosyltransferase involved in cell wall biosynthesis
MKQVVMLSTAASGGMAQVVNSLRESPLFSRYAVRVIATHDRGGARLRARLFITAFVQFCGLLLAGKIGLVHAHVAMRGSFWRKSLFLWTARVFRVPAIVHLHGSQFEEFYENECGPFRRRLIRDIFRNAKAVIVLSSKWRDYIAAAEPRAKLLVVHNFVDLGRLDSDRQRIAASRTNNIILFLGELGSRKGLYDLIRAMPIVLKSCPDARLIAGGTGEMHKVLEAIRHEGIEESVELPGWVTGDTKIRLLSQAALFVLPSHNENFPVSILEAMAAGLPVVSTPVGGIPDMIRDREEGLLIEPGNVDQLSTAITLLLSDPQLRSRTGRAARICIESKFSPEDAIRRIGDLYQSIPSLQRQLAPLPSAKYR